MNRRSEMGSAHRVKAVWQLLLAIVGGLALRSYNLTCRSMWFDEASSFTYATAFGFAETLERSARNVHPPLHYFILKAWILLFGDELWAMRMKSVAMGIATLIGLYLFCRDAYPANEGDRRSLGRRIGILAAAITAVSVPHVIWSQQLRMYTQATCLAAFSSWCMIRSLREAALNSGWLVAYVTTASALLYTHNYGLFTVFAEIGFMWMIAAKRWHPWRPKLGSTDTLQKAAFATTGIVAMYSPWLPVVARQTARVSSDYWTTPFDTFALAEVCRELALDGLTVPPIAGAVIGMGVILTLVAIARQAEDADWFIALSVALPVICASAVSCTGTPIIASRGFLMAHLFLLCAIARMICLCKPSWMRFALASVVLFSFATISVRVIGGDAARRPGLQGAIKHFLDNRSNDERILVLHPCLFHSTKYHCRGIGEPLLYTGVQHLSHYGAGPFTTETDKCSPEHLRKLGLQSVWVLDTTGYQAVEGYQLPPHWRLVSDRSAQFPDADAVRGVVKLSYYERLDIEHPDHDEGQPLN